MLSKNIKELRKKHGISQDKLSKLAGVSYNTVIKLETGGITNPTIETLSKITKVFKVSIDDLIR